MRRKRRVLVVTCHLPYPAVSGGRRRELELFTRLADEFELHLVAVSKTPDEDRANARELDEVFATSRVFEATDAGATCPVRRHASPAATAHIRRACRSGRFDLVHVESFYLLQHADPAAIPVVLVEQNVEFDLWRQRADAAQSELDRRRLLRQCRLTRDAEVGAWSSASVCAAVTEEDAQLMESMLPGLSSFVVPGGVDHLEPAATPREPSANELVFVGNFAYAPNVDAAWWFLERVFPRVRGRFPATTATLVGNAPPGELLAAAAHAGIHLTGRVADVRPYLARAAVVVAPLRVGGGVKVKVLEALHHGKAVVTTSVGAQGLRAGAGTAFLVEDDPDEFAAAAAALLADPRRRRRLERAAGAFARTLPTWDDAADALAGCYAACLSPALSLPAT